MQHSRQPDFAITAAPMRRSKDREPRRLEQFWSGLRAGCDLGVGLDRKDAPRLFERRLVLNRRTQFQPRGSGGPEAQASNLLCRGFKPAAQRPFLSRRFIQLPT
jgi:hypothetical protein